jgi:hypothetical protein
MFQSTLPRGARLSCGFSSRRTLCFIHAPARGATGGAQASPWPGWVSIHAPARGATCI